MLLFIVIYVNLGVVMQVCGLRGTNFRSYYGMGGLGKCVEVLQIMG